MDWFGIKRVNHLKFEDDGNAIGDSEADEAFVYAVPDDVKLFVSLSELFTKIVQLNELFQGSVFLIKLVLTELCGQFSFLNGLCKLSIVNKLVCCVWISPQIMISVRRSRGKFRIDELSISEITLVIELKYTSINKRRALSVTFHQHCHGLESWLNFIL